MESGKERRVVPIVFIVKQEVDVHDNVGVVSDCTTRSQSMIASDVLVRVY